MSFLSFVHCLSFKPYVVLVIPVFLACFSPKLFVLLVIPVLFDGFCSQTICFTSDPCDLRFSETFLSNLLERESWKSSEIISLKVL